MKYTDNYSANIVKIKNLLDTSDSIVIGAGAGLTAAGGINYSDPELTAKWFPQFAKFNFNNIMQIQSYFWNITKENALAYYAFWGSHLWHVRYEIGVLKPYSDLFKLIGDKNYFIITTNVDSQFEKAGFDKEKIFAMQGNYGLFQCSIPCSNAVYDNKEQIEKMLSNMTDEYHIREEDVPYCPNCGNYLIPNLRKDSHFVEAPHMIKGNDYQNFITDKSHKKTLLLELGIGFNTPSIIRYPFDEIAVTQSDKMNLIRINYDNANIPEGVSEESLGLKGDILKVMEDLTM